eukprot:TRINITY_DN6049_c0_g1_i1.p1 TRINITY_DN6049_c0_g1~~TRINITY_DN6049_c0_g1_i1.p1  ORF type:complete len:544 (-),score=84.35 TRINITY_DN6049_c0_g1_i1:97-1728(-)
MPFVVDSYHLCSFLSPFFFFNDTATTEIYTILFVGSVRCVQETDLILLILSLFAQQAFSVYTKKYIEARSEYLKRLYAKNPNSKIAVAPIQSNCMDLQLQNPTALEKTIMKSGYLKVKDGDGSALWYVFIGKQGITKPEDLENYPLLIWLNGGPGASSTDGLFFENGPFTLNKTAGGSIIEQPRQITWTSEYSMLFIDQPVGTGNSYAQNDNSFVTNMDQVAEQFYYALQQLPTLTKNCSFFQYYFNNNGKNSPVYITGESFGGKYIPSIASYILSQNKGSITNKISLQGIAIGDGFTEPITIASEYGAFAFNLGTIDYEERIEVERTILQMVTTSENGQWNKSSDLWNYLVNDVQSKGGNFFIYDMFEYSSPVNFGYSTQFFNQPGVAQLYNVAPGISFGSQSDLVYQNLYWNLLQPATSKVVDCINSGIKVLIYNGQDDFIVPNPGTMKWADKMQWDGSDNFINQDFQIWKYDQKSSNLIGNVGGYFKGYYDNKKWVEMRIVNKAGHFVPTYQPEYSLQMIQQFVNGKPGKQPDYMLKNYP